MTEASAATKFSLVDGTPRVGDFPGGFGLIGRETTTIDGATVDVMIPIR